MQEQELFWTLVWLEMTSFGLTVGEAICECKHTFIPVREEILAWHPSGPWHPSGQPRTDTLRVPNPLIPQHALEYNLVTHLHARSVGLTGRKPTETPLYTIESPTEYCTAVASLVSFSFHLIHRRYFCLKSWSLTGCV